MSVTEDPHGAARIARSERAESRSGRPGLLWVPGALPKSCWRRVRLSVIVRWQAARLDRELAAGVSPWSSELIARHAERISARRSRSGVARGLASVVRSATGATRGFTAAVRPDCQEVLAARTVFAALERRLRGPEPVAPRGMAMLRALLTEGTSPLYCPDEAGALGSQLRAAAAALEPGSR